MTDIEASLAQTTVLALPLNCVTKVRCGEVAFAARNRAREPVTGERLSRPLEGAKPARRGLIRFEGPRANNEYARQAEPYELLAKGGTSVAGQ